MDCEEIRIDIGYQIRRTEQRTEERYRQRVRIRRLFVWSAITEITVGCALCNRSGSY